MKKATLTRIGKISKIKKISKLAIALGFGVVICGTAMGPVFAGGHGHDKHHEEHHRDDRGHDRGVTLRRRLPTITRRQPTTTQRRSRTTTHRPTLRRRLRLRE